MANAARRRNAFEQRALVKAMKQHCRANENLYDLKGEIEKWRPAIFHAKHDPVVSEQVTRF